MIIWINYLPKKSVGLVRFELTTSSLSVITNVIRGPTVTYGNARA